VGFADAKFQKRVDTLLKKFDLVPENYEYYYQAFTHPSAASHPSKSYEVLEFLGDSIVLIHVILRLWRKHPDTEVGILSRAKSQIVSGGSLAKISYKLKLDKLIRYDDSILNAQKKISNNVMADVFEALVAAIFLDLGIRKVQKFLTKIFNDILSEDLAKTCHEDNKSILQETFQKYYKQIPQYKLIKTSGPDHDKKFYIQAYFRNVPLGNGAGRTKKIAEQEAACKTLKKIDYYRKRIDKKK